MRSIDFSADRVWVPRVITEAMPAIGASTRPASIFAATSAPTDEFAVEDQEHADDHQQQAGDLLGGVGAGQRNRRPEMHILAGARGRRHRALPGGLHAALGAGGAHGFQTGQRFNQHAVPRRRFGLQPLHGAVERTLQDKAKRDHERQHHQRDPGQRPRDHKENADEQDGKDQIGGRDHAAGGEELAHRIEIAQLVGDDADRGRPLRHLHRHHMFEDVGGQHDVDRLAGDVDHAAAYHAQHKIEHDRQPHSDRQRDQRRDRAVRDNPVVHAHNEQRRRQRQHVDQKGGQRNVPVTGPVHLDHRPEPMIARKVSCGDRTRVGFHRSPDQERVAGILRGDRCDRPNMSRARLDQGIEDLDGLLGRVDAEQNQRGPILHDQDGGEHQGRDVVQARV